MATLEQLQGILDRGLRDSVSPKVRIEFNEALRRGLIKSPISVPDPGVQPDTPPLSDGDIADDAFNRRVPPLEPDDDLAIQDNGPDGEIPAQGTEIAERDTVGTIDRAIAGTVEALATVGSSIGAEILAGLGGLGKAGTELLFGDLKLIGQQTPESREAAKRVADTIQGIREAATFQPRTEPGKQAVNAIGQVLEPIGKVFQTAEAFIGDRVMKTTGSPALASLAEAVPTIGAELAGFGLGKGVLKLRRSLKDDAVEGEITKALDEAVPTKEQLFDTSSALYRELDRSDVTVKSEAFRGLTQRLNADAKRKGLSKLTPESRAILDEFNTILDEVNATDAPVTLTEMDQLRKIAQSGSPTASRTDKAIASGIVRKIDEFMDTADKNALNVPAGQRADITRKFRDAQDLWGRGRKSETIQDAIEEAGKTASGFENGLRIEFRKILRKNSTSKRFFSKEEQAVMQKVIDGSKGANLARFLGKFSPFEGQSTRALTTLGGVGVGGAIVPGIGVVIMPTIGVISSKLAQKMTLGRAEFADTVIRAGRNGRKITGAYLDNVPKKQRDPSELAELLLNPRNSLENLPNTPFVNQALSIVEENRALLQGVVSGGAVIQANGENQ